MVDLLRNTTLRACLRIRCRHGASAHKLRQGNNVPFRAECEHCYCTGYIDPVVTSANRYNDQGQIVKGPALRPPRHFVPDIHARKLPLTAEERRAYWREKQKESRQKRRLADLTGIEIK